MTKNGADLAPELDSDLGLFIPESSDVADITDVTDSDKEEDYLGNQGKTFKISEMENSEIHQGTNLNIPIVSIADNENVLQHSSDSVLSSTFNSVPQRESRFRSAPLVGRMSVDNEMSGGKRVGLSDDNDADSREKNIINKIKNKDNFSDKLSGVPISSVDIGSRNREGVAVSEAAKKAIEQALIAASQWGGEEDLDPVAEEKRRRKERRREKRKEEEGEREDEGLDKNEDEEEEGEEKEKKKKKKEKKEKSGDKDKKKEKKSKEKAEDEDAELETEKKKKKKRSSRKPQDEEDSGSDFNFEGDRKSVV